MNPEIPHDEEMDDEDYLLSVMAATASTFRPRAVPVSCSCGEKVEALTAEIRELRKMLLASREAGAFAEEDPV